MNKYVSLLRLAAHSSEHGIAGKPVFGTLISLVYKGTPVHYEPSLMFCREFPIIISFSCVSSYESNYTQNHQGFSWDPCNSLEASIL